MHLAGGLDSDLLKSRMTERPPEVGVPDGCSIPKQAAVLGTALSWGRVACPWSPPAAPDLCPLSLLHPCCWLPHPQLLRPEFQQHFQVTKSPPGKAREALGFPGWGLCVSHRAPGVGWRPLKNQPHPRTVWGSILLGRTLGHPSQSEHT